MSPERRFRLLLLSYPLHPPRKLAELRTKHFPKLTRPAFFVHGTRDPFGKAGEVADAIRKGTDSARNSMVPVCIKGATIPHEVFSHYCGAKVLLRPASPGTGIIAGKTVRAVLESAGIKDILSKSLGSKNAANVVKATLKGLQSLRTRETIYEARGLAIKKAAPAPEVAAPAPAAAATN